MARLNEVPASTESLESLKRKFMRQNRDIARANSSQSLRIRTLENEVSKLLADNLDLRGQISHLQNELDNGKAKRTANYAIHIKTELEAKLQEIGALLGGLGEGPMPATKSPKLGKSIRASPNTSPDQKNWRNMCTLSEAVAGQEGRLPPILENKHYPRKTMEQQELRDLISNSDPISESTESPDIGPPPVSQFVDEDPVKIDLPRKQQTHQLDDAVDVGPALSFNLEQRRKRRESGNITDKKDCGTTEVSTGPSREVKSSLKTGAKRKLSTREEDDHNDTTSRTKSSPDDFKFTRVTNDEKTRNTDPSQSEKPAAKMPREPAAAKGTSREKPSAATATAGRKVLAPKSVNNSPKKFARGSVVGEIKAAKADVPKFGAAKDPSRERSRETILVRPENEHVADTVEIPTEPETPAALDIFSPPSTQPSTARGGESRDTPPPADLNPGSEGVRPSRRARGAVSYAEPSLRDKMRRPTKALADAVNRDGKVVHGAIIKAEEGTALSVTIKTEPVDEDVWQTMAPPCTATVENSPLRSKAPEGDQLPNSITTHRKRRESLLHQIQSDTSKLGSENSISAMVAEHRKAKAAAREKVLDKEDCNLIKSTENLDINNSNEPSPEIVEISRRTKEEPISRPTRRQSSITRDMISNDDGESSDFETTKRRQVTIGRRRQSTIGVRSESAEAAAERPSALKKSVSIQSFADPKPGDARSDRVSARRRSMML